MHARFASRCHRRAIRLAAASLLASTASFLFPVLALLAPNTAAAQVAPVAPHPYAPHVAEAARRFGIPEAWIWAVMRVESNGDANAVSPVGAMGLMQLMPATWATLTARYGLGSNVWDVRANILAGGAYLREMVDRYGDLSSALAAYNAGPGRVDDWRQRGRSLPAETIAYVAKIAPVLGMAGVASPAAVPAISPSPVAPSWRAAALFAARDQRTPDGSAPSSDVASVDKPTGMVSAPSVAPPMSSPRLSSPRSNTLFVALSGRSEQ